MSFFLYAIRGFLFAVRLGRSMRIQLCFAFYIIIAGLVVKISAGEWAVVLVCIGLVTGMECANTALEKLCDALCPGRDGRIGQVKDMMAGAVLLCAMASAAAGCVIFLRGEKFALTAAFATKNPYLTALIALSLIPASLFAFKGEYK